MAIEKKATKFTQKLARKILGSGLSLQVGDTGEIFAETAKNLPEGKLKNELFDNIQHYLDLFKTTCQNESHSEPEQLKEDESKSSHFELNLYSKNEEKGFSETKFTHDAELCLLYQEFDCIGEEAIISKLVQSKRNSKDKIQNLSKDINQYCDMLCGAYPQNRLKTVMKICYKKIQELYEDKVNKKNCENLKKLTNLVKETLAFFHFKFHRSPVDFDKPSYEDLLSAMLSVYLDLSLVLVRKQNEEEKKSKSKEITAFTVYLLHHAPYYIPEVILQQSALEEGDEIIIVPLCQRVFSATIPQNHRQYTTFIAVMKLIEEKFGSLATQNVKQMAMKLKPPKGYLDLLKEVEDEIPDTRTFKGVQITQFLLNEATMDTLDSLLDILTGDDDIVEEDNEKESEEKKESPKKSKQSKKANQQREEEDHHMEITIDRCGTKPSERPEILELESRISKEETENPVEEVVVLSENEESGEVVIDDSDQENREEFEEKQKTPSPKKKTPSSRKKTPSPKKKTPSPRKKTPSPKKNVIDLETFEPEIKKRRSQASCEANDMFFIDKSPRKPNKTISNHSEEIEIDDVVIREYESDSDIQMIEPKDTKRSSEIKEIIPENVKEGKDVYEFESDSEAAPFSRKKAIAEVDGSESDSSICSETGLRRSLRVRSRKSDVHNLLPDDGTASMDVDAIKDKILSKMPQLKASRRRSMPAQLPATPTRKTMTNKSVDSPLTKSKTPMAVSQKIEKLQMDDSFSDLVLPTDSPATPVRRSGRIRKMSEMSDTSSVAGDSPPKVQNDAVSKLRRSGRVRRFSDISDASSIAEERSPKVKTNLPSTPNKTSSRRKSKLQ